MKFLNLNRLCTGAQLTNALETLRMGSDYSVNYSEGAQNAEKARRMGPECCETTSNGSRIPLKKHTQSKGTRNAMKILKLGRECREHFSQNAEKTLRIDS
jgi:hypothetical protein